MRTVAFDADAYLRDSTKKWDLIIADFPDPSTPDTAKLYSVEFFHLVRRSLHAGGVFCVQSSSPYTNRSAYWTIADTLESAGFHTEPLHTHVPTFGEWGWHIATLSPQAFTELPKGLKYLNEKVLSASRVFPLPMQKLGEVKAASTRLDPVVLRHYLQGERLQGRVFFPGSAER